MLKNWKIFLIIILGINLFLLTQLKFTAWPETLLWPYLISKGWMPYKDIAIAHTPLMLTVLAVCYKIFGVGILQLKVFTWILILGIDLLIFGIVKKLWNVKSALIALSTFVFWQLFFDGNGLWFDLFMGAFVLFSYYLLKKKKYFWVGIFWALAFISKQTAVWFLLPIGLELTNKSLKPLVEFIKGVVLTLILFILSLGAFGILPSFIDWAVKFGIFILPKAQGQIQLPDLKSLAVSIFPFLIFIPLIWKTGKKNLNLLLWAFAGGLGAYPRFEYFHIQPALPFLAMASAITLTDLKKNNKLIKIFIVFYALGSIYLFANFFMRNWGEGTRFFETDVSDVINYVKNNVKTGDTIFVMNWWDSIYPLTETLPATTPWVPQLSWYQEIPGVQDKEVEDLKTSKPKLILLQDYSGTGLASYKPQKVLDFIELHYDLKEKVDGINVLIPK